MITSQKHRDSEFTDYSGVLLKIYMTLKKNTSSLLNRDLAASFSFWKPDILTWKRSIFSLRLLNWCCCSSKVDLTAERLIKAPPTRWRNCISAMVFGEVCLSEGFWWKMFSGIRREGFSKSFEHTLLLLVLLMLHRQFATQIESILDFRLVSLDFRHNRRARFLFCCRKSRILYFNVVGINCVFCRQWWLGRGIIKVTTECVTLCWRRDVGAGYSLA